jgi:hypothetical protein
MTIKSKLKVSKLPTPSSEEVGFHVLKGFTVPSGFVLNYVSPTGSDKVVRQGEFVDTNNKFQDIRDGKVPGWNLQKTQSDFDFKGFEVKDAEYEEHTFTPWGDKITVLGVPVVPEDMIKRVRTINRLGGVKGMSKNPEISSYLSEVRLFLHNTYNSPVGLPDEQVLRVFETVNKNINLLLSLENNSQVKSLFNSDNPPDVTSPALERKLNPNNYERIDFSSMTSELVQSLIDSLSLTHDEFLEQIAGIDDNEFAERYGSYIKSKAVKVNDKLMTREEAKSLIEESIQTIPYEVRPIVYTYLGGEDLVNQDLNTLIESLKESNYFFSGTLSNEEIQSLSPVSEIEISDLEKVKVEGYGLVDGRFEYLKRIISLDALRRIILTSGKTSESEQSVQDMISEIIENYIEFLGGDVYFYHELMSDWLKERYDSKAVKAATSWAEGKNTPEVKEIRSTMEAIQSAHSQIYENLLEGNVFRPINIETDVTTLSAEVLSPLVSFTLDYELSRKLSPTMLSAKIPPSKIAFLPCLYLPKPYWKTIKGKPMFVSRKKIEFDRRFEVVAKTKEAIVTGRQKFDDHEEVKVVIQ